MKIPLQFKKPAKEHQDATAGGRLILLASLRWHYPDQVQRV